MFYLIDNIKNNIDFFLRNKITLSRKNYYEAPQDLNNVLSEEQEKLYSELKTKYGSLICQNTTHRNFLLNLYYLNVFDKFLTKSPNDNITILDIGSKNWEYAKSEYMFFKSFAPKFTLNGIELDSNRLNTNFYSRFEIAKFYTKDLPDTNYIQGDFLKHEQKYDYIIWILPFVTKYPLIKWGLPLKYFKPSLMLNHAYKLLKPNGELLIINQGEKEYSIQQELINKTDVKDKMLFGEIEDCFDVFENKRFCTKVMK